MLDADRSPNAVSVDAGTSQVDFEVDRPPPARSTRRSFDHHGKGNGNFVSWVSKNEKKSYLSLIWKRWKREMTARLPVTVSSVQTWFYMTFVKKSSPGSTQLPTSRHLLSPPTVPRWHTYTHTHTYKIAGRLEPRRPPMKDEGTETAFRLDQCKHFRKSKHLLRSEVNRCDQSSIELHLRRSTSTGE